MNQNKQAVDIACVVGGKKDVLVLFGAYWI